MKMGLLVNQRGSFDGPDGEEAEKDERGRDCQNKHQEFSGFDEETSLHLHLC